MINKFKILLDIIMTLFMILLMKIDMLGIQAHEIMGIIIFILFIVHKIFNFKFIKAIGKNIFNKKLKTSSKIMFILDLVLLFFMFINVLTGVLISRFILTGLVSSNVEFNNMLHKFSAWWTLILIAIHIGLHLDNLVNYLTKKYKFFKGNNIIKTMILLIYFVFLVLGVNSLCKYSIYSKIIPAYNNSNQMIKERKYQNRKNNNIENNPTLEEYLSQFNCGECRKNCSLLYPKCEVGRKIREEKEKEYYEKYGNRHNNSINNEVKNEETKGHSENRKGKNKSNIIDIINIMLMFVGGTYYIKELIKKIK